MRAACWRVAGRYKVLIADPDLAREAQPVEYGADARGAFASEFGASLPRRLLRPASLSHCEARSGLRLDADVSTPFGPPPPPPSDRRRSRCTPIVFSSRSLLHRSIAAVHARRARALPPRSGGRSQIGSPHHGKRSLSCSADACLRALLVLVKYLWPRRSQVKILKRRRSDQIDPDFPPASIPITLGTYAIVVGCSSLCNPRELPPTSREK